METVLLAGAVAFGLVWALRGLIRAHAVATGLTDVPNHRSAHADPTPRGGGLAVVVVFLLSSLLLAFLLAFGVRETVALVGGGTMIASIGFLDDLRGCSASSRLAVHFVAAVFALASLGGVPPITFGAASVDLGWLGTLVGILLIVWATNLYNFMDGIDDLAAMEAGFVACASVFLVLLVSPSWKGLHWLAALGGCAMGYVVGNRGRHKIFLGDVGSGTLGFALAVVAIWTSRDVPRVSWAWAILLAVFIADATVTLVRRALLGRPVTEAHNSHAYQILARRARGHGAVVRGALLVNVCWLLPIACLAVRGTIDGWVATLVAYVPLVLLSIAVGAGRTEAVTRV